VHNVTERINVGSRLLDLQSDVLHVVLKRLNLRRSLSEEILGIGSLPLSDPLLETSLDGISLKRKSANLLLVLDLLNLILKLSEIE
jgi:hypothetical protein